MRTIWRFPFLMTVFLAIALAAIALGAVAPPNATRSGALATGPTPTYVSELAPAVSIAPRSAATLPATGGDAELQDALPISKVAGVMLALAGILLVHAGLRRRDGRVT
jgi:hypothetical protein